MATTTDFMEYICEQIQGVGNLRYRKLFGEYLLYVDDKPILLVCDNTVYVKMLDCLREKLANAPVGIPYSGAKEHYVLNPDDPALCREVVELLLPVTPLPKPKSKKKK